MYTVFSHFFTLLHTGVLFWSIAKIASLAAVFHVIIKILPPKLRLYSFVFLIIPTFILIQKSIINDFIQGYLSLASYYSEIKNYEKVIQYMKKAYVWGDRSPKTIAWFIRYYCETGDRQRAESIASEGLAISPNSPEILVPYGEMHLYFGNYETAASAGKLLIKNEDMFFWMKGYDILARALIRMDKITDAIQVIQEEISRVPSPEVKRILEAEITALVGSATFKVDKNGDK